MSNHDAEAQNANTFKELLGRKLVSYEVDYRKETLLMLFEGGHTLSIYLDDEACICLRAGEGIKH